MTRRSGGFRGAKPTWTTTSTSGIFGMEDVVDLKAAGQWPRGPVAPTSLAGTGGDQQVALTWQAPATTHGTITDYVVEYTPAAGSPTVVATGATAASYTVTGLTNDTEYTFRVAAVNHTRGDWSDSVAVTPSAAPTDPDFASVSLLLHFDGANGSTTFTDSSSQNLTSQITTSGAPVISTAQSKFGGSSLFLNGTGTFSSPGSRLNMPNVAALDPGTGDYTVECWLYPTVSVDGLEYAPFAFPMYSPFVNGGRITLRGTFYGPANVGTLPLNQWSFLSISKQGTTVYVHIDGVLAITFTESFGTHRLAHVGSGSETLSESPSPAYAFGGYIDEFRYTKGVCRYSGTNFTPPTAAFPDA